MATSVPNPDAEGQKTRPASAQNDDAGFVRKARQAQYSTASTQGAAADNRGKKATNGWGSLVADPIAQISLQTHPRPQTTATSNRRKPAAFSRNLAEKRHGSGTQFAALKNGES